MNVLKRNILLLLVLWPLAAGAHTTNMTTIALALAEDGSFEMTVEFDPGEKILGYQKYYEISRLSEPEQAAALAFLAQALEKELRLSFDGGRVLLQGGRWTLPNAPFESFMDTTTPTFTKLKLTGNAPARAERFDFTYTAALPLPLPVLVRVDKAGEKLPFSRVVDGPDQPMRTITLFKPPPPLLNEAELFAAACVVHGAKIFLAAYGRGLDPHWGAALIPLLFCVVLVLGHGGATDRWARLPLLAGAGVALAYLGARGTGLDLARGQEGITIALAGLGLLAGLVVAFSARRRILLYGLAPVIGLLWGLHIAGGPAAAADPVIPARVALALEAAGAGLAWLAAALLLRAAAYHLGRASTYPRWVVLPSGLILAVAAGGWLVDSLRNVS